MKTQAQLIAKFGDPSIDNVTFERKWMVLWDVPEDINKAIPCLPNKIYCNKLLVEPLTITLRTLIYNNYHKEIKTWDGCFNIRKKRGLSSMSLHSWGLAIDINAAWNPLGGKVTFSKEFLRVWHDNKWTVGAYWIKRPDGMHFQLDNF